MRAVHEATSVEIQARVSAGEPRKLPSRRWPETSLTWVVRVRKKTRARAKLQGLVTMRHFWGWT